MEHFYEPITGMFTFPNLYREMVQRFPSGSTFVEIGVFYGRSFAYLGVEMVNAGKEFNLIAIDNYGFVSEQDVIKNLSPLAGKFKTVCGNSHNVADNYPDKSVDFVFIDANHLEHAIRADIAAWLPKIKSGGVLAGHDYEMPDAVPHLWGVAKVVDELFGDNKRLTEGCWVVEVP